MPILRQFASLWTLTAYPSRAAEWSLDRKCRAVREAGFDGVHWDPFPELAAPLAANDLPFWGAMILDASSDLDASLERQAALGARRVNVQYGTPDDVPEAAAKRVVALVRAGAARGLEVSLETHRGRANDTPARHARLAAHYLALAGAPLPVTPDLSHSAVTLHLGPDRWPELVDDEVLAARQLHLRPFNGHHAQVPVTDGAGELSPEMSAWLDFARELLARWMAAPGNADAELWVCPELGPLPGGYALSCFPDVWDDTRRLSGEVAGLWRELGGAAAPG